MSCPVIAVICEPNMDGRVTCDARDLADAPERTDRTLPREKADPAAEARRALPSGTDLRGSTLPCLAPMPCCRAMSQVVDSAPRLSASGCALDADSSADNKRRHAIVGCPHTRGARYGCRRGRRGRCWS